MKQHNYWYRIIPLLLVILLPLGAWAQGLHAGPGIHLVITGAPTIVLHDAALVNDGELAPGNSTVVFTGSGSAPHSVIGGNSPVSFYHLTLNNASGALLLNNDISVSGRLNMNSGNLELNNHTLDLGATGSIQEERNDARITGNSGGTIKATAILNAPQALNPGNIGVEITSAANLGFTTITRGHVQQYNATAETGIHRYFDILPSANANLQASLRFYYFDDELAGNDKEALSIFHIKNGQQNWSLAGKDNTNPTAGWVVKTGLSQLDRYTLAMAKDGQATPFATTSVLAYPNPARDGFTLSIAAGRETDVVIGLYNQQGQLLETKRTHCLPGSSQLQWDIKKYAAGSYYLRFNQPGVKNMIILKQ